MAQSRLLDPRRNPVEIGRGGQDTAEGPDEIDRGNRIDLDEMVNRDPDRIWDIVPWFQWLLPEVRPEPQIQVRPAENMEPQELSILFAALEVNRLNSQINSRLKIDKPQVNAAQRSNMSHLESEAEAKKTNSKSSFLTLLRSVTDALTPR